MRQGTRSRLLFGVPLRGGTGHSGATLSACPVLPLLVRELSAPLAKKTVRIMETVLEIAVARPGLL